MTGTGGSDRRRRRTSVDRHGFSRWYEATKLDGPRCPLWRPFAPYPHLASKTVCERGRGEDGGTVRPVCQAETVTRRWTLWTRWRTRFVGGGCSSFESNKKGRILNGRTSRSTFDQPHVSVSPPTPTKAERGGRRREVTQSTEEEEEEAHRRVLALRIPAPPVLCPR